jgi:hypothetical protein
VADRRREQRPTRPGTPSAHEIEALLDSVPDLRPRQARDIAGNELAELLAAFDVTAT